MAPPPDDPPDPPGPAPDPPPSDEPPGPEQPGRPAEQASAPAQPPPPSFEDEFGQRVAAQRELLLRTARRLSGTTDAAQDLAQATMLRALIHRDQFNPSTRLETWLVRVLTNLFLDRVKHQKVVRAAEPQLVVLKPTASDRDDEPIGDDELRAAVQSLEPDLRTVVELCYMRGLRYREVAELLGLPCGTVATRLMRARERLREILTSTSRRAAKP